MSEVAGLWHSTRARTAALVIVMPIYEYECKQCGRQFSFLHGVIARTDKPKCPRCGGRRLTKLVSRVSRGRTEDDLFDRMDPSDVSDPEDPKQVMRWAKEMSKHMGEDMEDDFEEEFEKMLEGDVEGAEESMAGPGDRDEIL